MKQNERWQIHDERIIEFTVTYHRRPSKNRIEEHVYAYKEDDC